MLTNVFLTIEQSMRESMATKPIYIYIYIYIYIDAPDTNMLTNVFFACLFFLYFIESDTCTTDES